MKWKMFFCLKHFYAEKQFVRGDLRIFLLYEKIVFNERKGIFIN